MNKEKRIISIDATDKIYGRLASEVAAHVRGKNIAGFTPHIVPNIYVEIAHIEDSKLTGKKREQKKYQSHSRYPGGFSEEQFIKKFNKNPKQTFLDTVRLMLPNNKLRKELLKHISFC